jgi:hypothetical protein
MTLKSGFKLGKWAPGSLWEEILTAHTTKTLWGNADQSPRCKPQTKHHLEQRPLGTARNGLGRAAALQVGRSAGRQGRKDQCPRQPVLDRKEECQKTGCLLSRGCWLHELPLCPACLLSLQLPLPSRYSPLPATAGDFLCLLGFTQFQGS